MPHEINTLSNDGTTFSGVVNRYPDYCPLCHIAVELLPMACSIRRRDRDRYNYVEIVFRCPRHACDHLFIARYRAEGTTGRHRQSFLLRDAVPTTPLEPNFPKTIEELSPHSTRIFTQASEAEDRQLDEIAGVGYRKALEYLIKDYLIHSAETDEQKNEYKRTPLGKCIRDYVTDPKVKLCAERAAWLGNDETHYERKWNDNDLGDLKTLIRLATNWIENELLTEKYAQTMPPK